MSRILDERQILVEDVYKPDLVHEATAVFGANDPAHPSVQYLRTRVNPYYIGGKVQAVQAPTHHDYVSLRCKSHFVLQTYFSLSFSSPS